MPVNSLGLSGNEGGGGGGGNGAPGRTGTGISNITFDDNNDGSVTIHVSMTDGTSYTGSGTLVSDNIISLNKLNLTGTNMFDKFVVKDNAGQYVFVVATDGAIVSTYYPIQAANGSKTTPSYAFTNGDSTGMYFVRNGASQELSFTVGDNRIGFFNETALNLTSALRQTTSISTQSLLRMDSNSGFTTPLRIWNASNSVSSSVGAMLEFVTGSTTGNFIGANGLGQMVIAASGNSVIPYASGTYSLGTSGNRWGSLYSGTGNYSGLITATGGINLPSLTASSLLQLDASKNVTTSNTLPTGCTANNITLTGFTNISNPQYFNGYPNPRTLFDTESLAMGMNQANPAAYNKLNNSFGGAKIGMWMGDVSNSSQFYVDLAQYNTGASSVSRRYNFLYSSLHPQVNNSCSLGLTGQRWSDIYSYNPVTVTSDENEKKDIETSPLGLDFIDKLRPVRYRWKVNESNRYHYGMIAQEVEDVLTENNISTIDFGGFIHSTYVEDDVEKETYGLRYTEFISPMIKAIQELKEIATQQQIEIHSLQDQIDLINGE